MADRPVEGDGGPTRHDAQDARGGEIILRTRRLRILFVAGLVLTVVVALLLGLAVRA